ncbi:DUF4123 domain-containing protein [Jannaschia marina]|uniref:DUF4123 domain-containing protein n=1 Tax=Jannaschia marina TaxID=2741674 RepID=UPI0015CE0E3C|nr:DUF4123 domain-containing protein [Jannaschia marina]
MTTGADDSDYWTNLPGPSVEGGDGASTPALNVETIEGVEPLDAQLGVAEPLTVPPALYEALFGQPEVIEGRAILPLHTYAVLDAAKLPGLPEMLETSGLDHACLFQGAAAEELRDVAPYLVRLEEGHRFTRGLFTQGEGPGDMWDRESGIFLRSQGSLNDLRKHLRKFTKLQDGEGKWFYFRFWEHHVQEALIHGGAGTRAFSNNMLAPIGGWSQRWLIADVAAGRLICLEGPAVEGWSSSPIWLDPDTFAALGTATRIRLMRDEAIAALCLSPQRQREDRIFPSDLEELWSRLRKTGFAEPKDRIQAMSLYLRYHASGRHEEAWAVLSEPGPGPGIRLWRLSQAIVEQS